MGFHQIRKFTQQQKEERRQEFLAQSNEKLHNTIKSFLMTTAIGDISKFETSFGDLWGHGLTEDKLTQDQLDNRRIWNEVRTKILDELNKKIRLLESIFGEYTIEWKRYHKELRIGN
jgi:hypothetical protein